VNGAVIAQGNQCIFIVRHSYEPNLCLSIINSMRQPSISFVRRTKLMRVGGGLPNVQLKSILILKSPTTCVWVRSIGLWPARSSISLLASNLTYSDFALFERLTTCFKDLVADKPIILCTSWKSLCCTCGSFKVLLAVTLPLSPLAYPANCDASLMLCPFATAVISNSCFLVNF